MKILQLCLRVPYPPTDGGNIAMYNLASGLHDLGHDITMVCINTPKHHIQTEPLPSRLKKFNAFYAMDVDTTVKISGALANLISNESYNVMRFYSSEFAAMLAKILSSTEFDVIQVESLFMATYVETIRKHSRAKIILRAHNVEFKIWEKLADGEKNMLKEWYLRLLSRRLMQYEMKMLNQFDGLLPITVEDERSFKMLGCASPTCVVPAGLDSEAYHMNLNEVIPHSFFHLGSMSWLPNKEGVRWLLSEVWPIVHQADASCKLYLAGHGMPIDIIEKAPVGVQAESRVENAISYLQNKQVMVVPLHSGSGMRVKIVEGMAMGKTIISTSLGAEGIGARHGKNIIIANSAKEFAEAMLKCISNPDWCQEIGVAARKLFETDFTTSKISAKLSRFYSELA